MKMLLCDWPKPTYAALRYTRLITFFNNLRLVGYFILGRRKSLCVPKRPVKLILYKLPHQTPCHRISVYSYDASVGVCIFTPNRGPYNYNDITEKNDIMISEGPFDGFFEV